MAPVEHASDELRSIEDEGKSSMSPCLPLIVFQHQSRQHENEHEMLMFSVSQKRLLLHAADMAPDLVAGSNDMFWTSPQGWMLVASSRSPSSSAAWLWNPRTGDKITLPLQGRLPPRDELGDNLAGGVIRPALPGLRLLCRL